MQKSFGRWELEKEDVAKNVTATVDHLRHLAATRHEKESRFLRMYCPDPSGNTTNLIGYLRRDRPQFNLVKQGVDTQLAMVASQKFMPRYIITEGSFDLGRVARLRTRVLEGLVEDLKISAQMYMAALDAYTLGTGHLIGYLDPDTSEPVIERCLPGEVVVDPHSTVNGKATKAYRRRSISADVLCDLYPSIEDHLIRSSTKPTAKDKLLKDLPSDNTVDEVRVDEAWSLPVGDRPGRHVICTSKVILLDEEWKHSMLPVIPVYYQKRPLGYWGIGIAEIIQDEQARLDRILTRIDACQEIDATIFIMATNPQQKFQSETVPGAPARVFRATGGQPAQFHNFRGTSAHLTQEVEAIRERFLSLLGISQLQAENKKPAGITSAVGQRTFADLSQQRQRQISDNFKEAWQQVIELLEILCEERQNQPGEGYEVVARTTRGLVPLVRRVKWSDAHLPSEQYRLSLQLVSDTPRQVGSVIEQVQEWIQSGFSRRDFAQKQVLDNPSDDFQRRETADVDYACWMVEQVLDGNFDVQLDPYLKPEVAFDVFRTSYLPVKSDGAPEDVLNKLRELIRDAQSAIERKQGVPGPQDPTGNYAPPAGQQLPQMTPPAQ